ncbi:hypothetical protein N1851_024978 [Merluccius polli]|uniref:DUF5641 domain-containing protein n=1 Tax=Merluccius polli TaxID=89951 RepID=A0AA47NV51_MERPO|nr:hypothetical protein N1851_024978 [Merluccius polli]
MPTEISPNGRLLTTYIRCANHSHLARLSRAPSSSPLRLMHHTPPQPTTCLVNTVTSTHHSLPDAQQFSTFGELREIRSVMAALTGTLGSQVVSGEVLTTILIEIEGILNSKPLGYVSSDVADPVTPNLLLMGRPDPSLPQAVYHDSELLSRRQWRVCQVLSDRFWVQFLRHYLPTLQTQSKWQADTSPLQLDTIVMIVDPQLPRASWPVGKIKKVFPGADGLIRTAEVEVRDRTYIRPVSRLIRLPAVPEEDGQ